MIVGCMFIQAFIEKGMKIKGYYLYCSTVAQECIFIIQTKVQFLTLESRVLIERGKKSEFLK